MKKVAFVVHDFPNPSQTFVERQIVAAIDLGYDLSVLVRKKSDIGQSSLKAQNDQYALLDKTIQIDSLIPKKKWLIPFKALSFLFKVPLKFYATFNPFRYSNDGLKGILFFGLVEYRQHLDADIYHVQFGTSHFPLAHLKKHELIQGEILTTFHGKDAHFQESTLNKIKNSYSTLFKVGKSFTANTPYLSQKLLDLDCPEHKLRVMPMCVDTLFFTPNKIMKNKRRTVLITVGRLVKIKGQEFGIRVVKLLKEKGVDVKYNVIGEGEDMSKLKELIVSLNLENEVNLLGRRSQQETKELLQESDLYLMTSTFDETGRREAQGVVVAEAQACGLPVCGFNSGGVPFTIENKVTGYLSNENNLEDMAANVEKLLRDSSLLMRMSTAARRLAVQEFSLEVLKQNLKSLYS